MAREVEVVDEARAIREAMQALGWSYIGGGPYPHNPILRFRRGLELMKIAIEAKEG